MHPIDDQFVNEGTALTITAFGVDPDGDALVWHAFGLPSGAAFDSLTATLEWTPTFSQAGVHVVNVVADDGHGGMNGDEFSIFVGDVPVSDAGSTLSGVPRHLAITLSGENPFRQHLGFVVAAPSDARVQVTVHDVRGRLVRRLGTVARAGYMSMQWDGRDLSGHAASRGVYYLRASGRSEVATRSVVKLR